MQPIGTSGKILEFSMKLGIYMMVLYKMKGIFKIVYK